ncbi:hypothetical protein CVT25_004357, partial [Psilocybe cyanescens]
KPKAKTHTLATSGSRKHPAPKTDLLDKQPASKKAKMILGDKDYLEITECPAEMCNDKVPAQFNPDLESVMQEYSAARVGLHNSSAKNTKHWTTKLRLATQLLCAQIAKANKNPGILDMAIERSWPLEIDYSKLCCHIKRLESAIVEVLNNFHALDVIPPWQSAMELRHKWGIISTTGTSGYQTLEEAAAPASENTQDKGDIQYLSKRAKSFWDSCRDLQWNALELDLDTFCEVVVAAHITNLLIRQDLECTYDEADNTRMESIRYGDIYNGLGSSEEESDKFDNIFRDIVAEGKKIKVTAVSTQANNQDIAMVAIPPQFL